MKPKRQSVSSCFRPYVSFEASGGKATVQESPEATGTTLSSEDSHRSVKSVSATPRIRSSSPPSTSTRCSLNSSMSCCSTSIADQFSVIGGLRRFDASSPADALGRFHRSTGLVNQGRSRERHFLPSSSSDSITGDDSWRCCETNKASLVAKRESSIQGSVVPRTVAPILEVGRRTTQRLRPDVKLSNKSTVTVDSLFSSDSSRNQNSNLKRSRSSLILQSPGDENRGPGIREDFHGGVSYSLASLYPRNSSGCPTRTCSSPIYSSHPGRRRASCPMRSPSGLSNRHLAPSPVHPCDEYLERSVNRSELSQSIRDDGSTDERTRRKSKKGSGPSHVTADPR